MPCSIKEQPVFFHSVFGFLCVLNSKKNSLVTLPHSSKSVYVLIKLLHIYVGEHGKHGSMGRQPVCVPGVLGGLVCWLLAHATMSTLLLLAVRARFRLA